MDVPETTTPAAFETTRWARSKMPMTMVQVFETMSTAAKVLSIQRNSSQKSTSFILFFSVMI